MPHCRYQHGSAVSIVEGVNAAILEQFGRPLTVAAVPDPPRNGGEVLVDVLSAPVLPYSAEVFSGERRYPLAPPVIPGVGGIGRIAEAGPDATQLNVGDLVWCDPTVRSRDNASTPDITLQGWSSRGEGGLRLSRHFHHGAFAQRMAVPTENIAPVPEGADPARWSGIGIYLVPYGGLLAVDLRAGETLLVSGATGNYGSAAVAVGLAMGAARVVCPGRNAAALADLRRTFGERVRPVMLTGRPEDDRTAMLDAGDGAVDVVIDLLPPSVSTEVVRTAVLTVREHGRVVLMGGVGMLGGEELRLPYPWLMRNCVTVRGQWMYDRTAIPRLIELARSGLLDLEHDTVTTFRLEQVNEAITHAAHDDGPFHRTVITPGL